MQLITAMYLCPCMVRWAGPRPRERSAASSLRTRREVSWSTWLNPWVKARSASASPPPARTREFYRLIIHQPVTHGWPEGASLVGVLRRVAGVPVALVRVARCRGLDAV